MWWSSSTPPVLPTSFSRCVANVSVTPSGFERSAGARTLDVDVLWVDGETVDDPPELLVPHPRMFERAFVLVPLADLAPDVVPDGYDVVAAATAEGVRNVGRLEEQ